MGAEAKDAGADGLYAHRGAPWILREPPRAATDLVAIRTISASFQASGFVEEAFIITILLRRETTQPLVSIATTAIQAAGNGAESGVS